MVTRTGKIARLPHNIREQINDRLLDGHSALSILPWLNDLPEVQAILQTQFEERLNLKRIAADDHALRRA